MAHLIKSVKNVYQDLTQTSGFIKLKIDSWKAKLAQNLLVLVVIAVPL